MVIKERRKKLGWSRADLAAHAEVNSGVIGLMERGQWNEAQSLAKVKEALDRAESEG